MKPAPSTCTSSSTVWLCASPASKPVVDVFPDGQAQVCRLGGSCQIAERRFALRKPLTEAQSWLDGSGARHAVIYGNNERHRRNAGPILRRFHFLFGPTRGSCPTGRNHSHNGQKGDGLSPIVWIGSSLLGLLDLFLLPQSSFSQKVSGISVNEIQHLSQTASRSRHATVAVEPRCRISARHRDHRGTASCRRLVATVA